MEQTSIKANDKYTERAREILIGHKTRTSVEVEFLIKEITRALEQTALESKLEILVTYVPLTAAEYIKELQTQLEQLTGKKR